nr:Ty3/gypsy retrotransposon protein [Tanacetum cinerariifolium]
MRLDVLNFSRDDLDRWIFAITEYFSLLNSQTDQHLRIVEFNLEGTAAEWFRWMSMNGFITTWARFEESVKNRFGPSKYKDPRRALLKLLQLGTIKDYQREFEKLINRVTDIPDSLLISLHISGLKLNLQHEFLLSRPTTLGNAFSLAGITDARFEAIAEKEQNIKEKADITLSLPIEKVSPILKGLLDASEDTLRMVFAWPVDEVNSVIKDVFDIDESNVEGGNSDLAYYPYHLEVKVNFETVRNVTPYAVEVRRRKKVKCFVQGSGMRKSKMV